MRTYENKIKVKEEKKKFKLNLNWSKINTQGIPFKTIK